MKNKSMNGSSLSALDFSTLAGGLLVFMGFAVILLPAFASVRVAWLLGCGLLAAGATQFVHALSSTHASGSVGRYLRAAVAVVVGFIIIRQPLAGADVITLRLALYLIVGSLAQMMVYLGTQAEPPGTTNLLSALSSAGLGVFLLFTFPVTSLVIPGTLVGTDLLFFGATLIITSRNSRQAIGRFDHYYRAA